jgi:hypothetical protein
MAAPSGGEVGMVKGGNTMTAVFSRPMRVAPFAQVDHSPMNAGEFYYTCPVPNDLLSASNRSKVCYGREMGKNGEAEWVSW